MEKMLALWIVDEDDNTCEVPLVINKNDIGSHKVNKWLKLNLPYYLGIVDVNKTIEDNILKMVLALSGNNVAEWVIYGKYTINWREVEVV